MKYEQFTTIFAEDIVMVEVEEITSDTILDDLEDWDSMAAVALNGALDEYFGFTLKGDEIKVLVTYNDILTMIDQKKTL